MTHQPSESAAGQFAPPTTPPPSVGTPPRQRLRDRLFRLRSLVAVGLAGLIIGGGAGAGAMAIARSGAHPGAGPDRGRFPGQLGPGAGHWGQLPGAGGAPGSADGHDQQGSNS